MAVEGLRTRIVDRDLERDRDTPHAGQLLLTCLHQQAPEAIAAPLRRHVDSDEVTHFAAGFEFPIDHAKARNQAAGFGDRGSAARMAHKKLQLRAGIGDLRWKAARVQQLKLREVLRFKRTQPDLREA